MNVVVGNLWEYHAESKWIGVTTNGYVKTNGCAVMGRGIALQAARKFPELPAKLGRKLSIGGNVVFIFPEYHIITFPVKHVWYAAADLDLILHSANTLADMLTYYADISHVYLPPPGCGNGGRTWSEVKPLLEKSNLSSTQFTIVNYAQLNS